MIAPHQTLEAKRWRAHRKPIFHTQTDIKPLQANRTAHSHKGSSCKQRKPQHRDYRYVVYCTTLKAMNPTTTTKASASITLGCGRAIKRSTSG